MTTVTASSSAPEPNVPDTIPRGLGELASAWPIWVLVLFVVVAVAVTVARSSRGRRLGPLSRASRRRQGGQDQQRVGLRRLEPGATEPQIDHSERTAP